MHAKRLLRHTALPLLLAPFVHAQPSNPSPPPGTLTIGAAVYTPSLQFVTNIVPPLAGTAFYPPPADLPLQIRQAMAAFIRQGTPRVTIFTNGVFDHFLPDSLQNLVWTNLLTLTNGKSMSIWQVRTHPPDWPAHPPVVQWNPYCLMWGMKGLTGLSPCWEGEGLSGQVPITALTRRHGYTRGHSMGPNGFRTQFAGKKVWFVDTSNRLVEATVSREVVRTVPSAGIDYTILLFNRDLPGSIQPLRVIDPQAMALSVSRDYPNISPPNVFLETEQAGQVSTGLPGFTCNTWKGGDSGSPNMLPFPGELIFSSGRSTSGASAQMQADMDELCRLEGLDARRYQLQWVVVGVKR